MHDHITISCLRCTSRVIIILFLYFVALTSLHPFFTLNHIIDGPSSGEVRLYYSYYCPIYYYGLVEVYLSEEWGTVANDGSWTLEDGEVICRQLGYEIARMFN